MKLSTEQQTIVDETMLRLHLSGCSRRSILFGNHEPFQLRIGGYAGTGKTTLICHLREKIKEVYPNINVAFATFTGKASAVLAEKLKNNNMIFSNDYVGTIHKLIYKAIVRYNPKLKTHTIVGWELREPDELFYELIIIDEASMISKSIWDDLVLFNRSIVSIGDHGQLPPIGDRFSLMKNPDFKLQTIHRQALNSPIIKLSQMVRRQGYIPEKAYSKDVLKMSWNKKMCRKIWNEKVVFDKDLMVLCGFNTTRWELNEIIREKLERNKFVVPYPGEQVVCLSNNHKNKIMNGQIGTVVFMAAEEMKNIRRMDVLIGDDIIESILSLECFGQVTYTLYEKNEEKEKQLRYAKSKNIQIDYFDYGYALSVHKSQGSEWPRVVLFEQRSSHWDDDMYMRWLYTAITRSSEKLFIISDYY